MTTYPASLAAEERLADADITSAIERLFLLKKGVASQLIEVACHEGIVELSGFTDSLLSRGRAADLARAVRGVRGVINDILIRTPDVPDAELERRVRQALRQDPAACDYNVRCHIHDGVVTLHGTLQTWAEGQLVLLVVNGVPGVRQINNNLNVRGGSITNSDEEITTQIRESLAWDIRVKSPLVDVRTDHGVVHLSGTVGTADEHEQVVATAYLAGATHVDARHLVVAYWALDQGLRRQRFVPKADEDVAQAVRDALRLDPRVRAFAPTVHVRDGVVTLAGTVGNLRARRTAEQDATNVLGANEVRNLLQVRVQFPSPDGLIHQHVKTALACNYWVGRYNFTTNVSNGKVQLFGTVGSHFDLEQAADVVAGVNGVVELANHVQLVPFRELRYAPPADAAGPPAAAENTEPDLLLEQRIRNRYHWSSLLHDQDIDVRVRDGRATLAGSVDTWLERKRAAVEAADCGARDVNNHLRLLGHPN